MLRTDGLPWYAALLLFGLLTAAPSQAQTTLQGSLGVSAFTVVGGESAGDRTVFVFPTAGLAVRRPLPLPGAFSVEIGLYYVGKGATSEGIVSIDEEPTEATTELRLAYLDVPVLLRTDLALRSDVAVALFGGLAFEFLLDEGIEIITSDGSVSGGVLSTDNFNTAAIAGQVGAAIVFERFEIKVRYHRSLSDASSDEASPAFRDLKHSGALFTLGYRL